MGAIRTSSSRIAGYVCGLGLLGAASLGCGSGSGSKGTDCGGNCKVPTITPPPAIASASCVAAFSEDTTCPTATGGAVYYVSTSGSDGNDGLSEAMPIKSLAHAGDLAVGPGDRVLFKCGDTWRNEILILSHSGEACRNVVYGSYPAVCENQPHFSGSYPITGWTQGSGGIWSANLLSGSNAGHFPNGINQLFKGEARLPLGRWPNRDDANFPGGYSRIVTHTGGKTIGDPRLPGGDWTGAVFHHFSIRWLLLNSLVAQSGSGSLTLANSIDCYDGCGDPNPNDAKDFGWGYFLANHRLTLDKEGEWFYDNKTHEIMLVAGAAPTGIEGSVVPAGVVDAKDPSNDEGFHGLVDLGANLGAPIHHVVLENLRLENNWRHGIGTAITLRGGENRDVIIRCNTIRNPDGTGVILASWPIGPNEWQGGDRITVSNNVIDGPNHFGIHSFGRNCHFQGNLITDIGLIDNLGPSGLGCGLGSGNCTTNGDGIAMETFYGGDPPIGMDLHNNRIKRTGQCGIDAVGVAVTVEENVIEQSCSSKGDCGGICALDASAIAIRRNIVRDPISPPEGFNSSYHERFAFGLYIDNSPGDCQDNTVIHTQGYGIIYQGGTTGDVTGNTVYGVEGRVLVFAGFGGTINNLTGNIMVGAKAIRLMFTEADGRILASDRNYFIQPYTNGYISMQSAEWKLMDLPQWQIFSGQDNNSMSAWFTTAEGAAPTTEIFVNDTAAEKSVALGRAYVDLDRKPVSGSLTLAPYSSRVLVQQ